MCFFACCTSNVPRARRGRAPAGTAMGSAPPMDVVQQAWIVEAPAGRHGAGVGWPGLTRQ